MPSPSAARQVGKSMNSHKRRASGRKACEAVKQLASLVCSDASVVLAHVAAED
jgi:hypothetical protein